MAQVSSRSSTTSTSVSETESTSTNQTSVVILLTSDSHSSASSTASGSETEKSSSSKSHGSDSTKSKTAVKRLRPVTKVLSVILRPVTKFLRSEPEEYRTLKMFIGFPAGCLFGYGLFILVIAPMNLGEEIRRLLGTLLVFGLASGFSSAVGVRCVCILMLPTFMGKEGRSFIGAYAIALLIEGPVANLIVNGKDITRSLTCAAELSANHTAAKWKLRTDPLSNVLKDMQSEGFLLNDVGKKVHEAFRPMKEEIRDEEAVAAMEKRTKTLDKANGGRDNRAAHVRQHTKTGPAAPNSKKVTNDYKKKLEFRCEDIYNKAIAKCKGIFNGIKDDCFDFLPSVVDDIVCPLVNLGFLCDIIKAIGSALGANCDSDIAVMNSFGKAYTESEDTMDNLDQGFEVDVKYKVIKSREEVDYTSVEQMRSQTIHEFERGRKWTEFVMILFRRLLGFTFLLVVFGAYKYYKKYTGDIRFDNIYITSYFRKIDARRKQQDKRVLLPLKKVEADACIYTSSPKLMKSERAKLGKGTMLLLARALLAGMVFFIDNMLTSVLEIIRDQSRVDFKQTGTNHIEIKVEGTGVMSNIVRLFLNGLSGKTTLDKVSSNTRCLPRPSEVDVIFYWEVFGIFLGVWILLFLDAYALRLRRLIAGFFFRKREKMRILYMYNTMMGKRKCFLLDMRRRVKRKAKKLQLSRHSGVLYALRRQFPGLCGWLALCQRSKNTCLICDDIEDKMKDFRSCDTPGCTFMYCRECWCDIKGTCYACLPVEDFSSTDTSDIGSDTEDDI